MQRRSGIPSLPRTGRGVLLTAGLALLLGALVQLVAPQLTGGIVLLDTRMAWTADDARRVMQQLGPSGRLGYAWLLPLDAASGVAFGVAAATVLAWVRGRSGARWVRTALVVGVVAGLAVSALDLVENVLVGVLIATWPDLAAGVVAFASAVTTVKLVLVPALVVAVLLSLVATLVTTVRARHRRGGRHSGDAPS